VGEQNKRSHLARKHHPVWEVYNALRTAKLSETYYTAKLRNAKRNNNFWEVAIAAFVPSSAIAGLPMWTTTYGNYLWGGLILIASLLAIAKPIVNPAATIQSYEASISRYRTIVGNLEELRRDIENKQCYNQELQARFKYIAAAMTRAQEIEPTEPIDEELRSRLSQRINNDLPISEFYVPGDEQ
jgi:hypothetical protein